MYQDIELKINYHREKIIQSFIKKGVYPDNRMIQARLNSIEMRSSIFKNPNIKEGTNFDVTEMNNSIKHIYKDLDILYNLLFNISVTEYNKLNNYINSHLKELNDTATMYLKRAELESYTTAIGQSIFFKEKEFDIELLDTTTIIELGEIEIEDASKIACIASINNIDHSNAVFKFNNVKETDILLCNSYSYNHDTLLMPGEQTIESYPYEIQESQKINGLLELNIAPKTTDGKFVTLTGKSKIIYKKADEDGEIIEETPVAINALSFSGHSYIDFFVVGGSSISFRFNKKPISANFNYSENTIENLDYVHHFFIECDDNFSFDFELDKGDVYAYKEDTIINQDSYFYTGQIELNDFLVLQYRPGQRQKYNAWIELYNTSITEDEIDSLMIKKIR